MITDIALIYCKLPAISAGSVFNKQFVVDEEHSTCQKKTFDLCQKKGLDTLFLYYGIRKEDIRLIEVLCLELQLNFD